MKRFESGEALAKEMGIPASVLQKTFDTYNAGVKAKKDPFGKKVCLMIETRGLTLTLGDSSSRLASGR